MGIEEKYNIEAMAKNIYDEMKERGNETDAFEDYWFPVMQSFRTKGIKNSEMEQAKEAVLEKLEEMFERSV